VAHSVRAELKARYPVHVVLRVIHDVGNLRRRATYHAIRRATLQVAERADFRITQLSIQRTHVHMLVEANDKRALARGMQGFQISAAKHINAALMDVMGKRRMGSVFADRYHATIITTPRQTRHVLGYVLGNWRHHCEDRDARVAGWRVDWFSSAPSFEDWAEYDGKPLQSGPVSYEPLRVDPPETWLLRHGWKKHGARLSCFAVPARA
jgi:putative transposase